MRAGAYYNLGNAHYAKGEYAPAVEVFRKAVTLNLDAEARQNLPWRCASSEPPPKDKKNDKDKKERPSEGQVQDKTAASRRRHGLRTR